MTEQSKAAKDSPRLTRWQVSMILGWHNGGNVRELVDSAVKRANEAGVTVDD